MHFNILIAVIWSIRGFSKLLKHLPHNRHSSLLSLNEQLHAKQRDPIQRTSTCINLWRSLKQKETVIWSCSAIFVTSKLGVQDKCTWVRKCVCVCVCVCVCMPVCACVHVCMCDLDVRLNLCQCAFESMSSIYNVYTLYKKKYKCFGPVWVRTRSSMYPLLFITETASMTAATTPPTFDVPFQSQSLSTVVVGWGPVGRHLDGVREMIQCHVHVSSLCCLHPLHLQCSGLLHLLILRNTWPIWRRLYYINVFYKIYIIRLISYSYIYIYMFVVCMQAIAIRG